MAFAQDTLQMGETEDSRPIVSKGMGTQESLGEASTQAYDVGSFFVGNDGYMYKVTATIALGETITVDTNCTQTDIASAMETLLKIDPDNDGIIAIENGGTGATSASTARSNLELGSLATENDVDLTSEVTGALPVANGGTGATDASTARTNLGLGGLSTEDTVDLTSEVTNALPLANGGTGATTASVARTNLELGSLATKDNVDLTSDVSGVLPIANGGTGIDSNPSMLINLASTSADDVLGTSPRPGVTGTLAVGSGGTGVSSVTSGSVLIGNGTDAMTEKAIDSTPTSSSTNLITSGGVKSAIAVIEAETPWYATSDTAQSTTAKVATTAQSGFTLTTGAKVIVKFDYTNTATSPTLNVNATGAVSIKGYGTTAPSLWWLAGDVVEFTYDGTNWLMQPTQGEIETLNSNLTNLTAIHESNAGAHNCIYRGKYLGTSVTSAQYDAINNGTFDDLYIGDYWTINDVNYRIAAFDYWLNTGSTACDTHHVVIVPDTNLDNQPMNSTAITDGGYVGSEMYTTNLNTAKSTITSAFGSAHILSHTEYLTNEVTNGYASAGTWYDSTVELMNEVMVYGCSFFTPHNSLGATIPNTNTTDKSQLPLFRHDHSRITNRTFWWLRDVVSASNFALVSNGGNCYARSASYSGGIRPAFGIIA